jgi:hypothetical protein
MKKLIIMIQNLREWLPFLPRGPIDFNTPVLMPNRKAVQRLPAKSPLGNEEVHKGDEAAIVSGFQQVGHSYPHENNAIRAQNGKLGSRSQDFKTKLGLSFH